jgi:hypothetical protein
MKKPKKSRQPMKERPKFTGVLNQPIVESAFCKEVIEIYGPSATREDADKRLLDLRIAKIPMLLDHYGIKGDDDGLWAKLSYALACDFVPGFQWRPSFWALKLGPHWQRAVQRWQGDPRFMETSIFVTDLAQQFSLPAVGPSHPIGVPRWPEQASANFLILGLSFLSACQQLASSFVKRT